jgi:hypothetical protein
MIPSNKINTQVQIKIGFAPIIPDISNITLMDKILQANRTNKTLKPFREKTRNKRENI